MMKEKNTLLVEICVLSDKNKRLNFKKSFIILVRNYLFLKTYATSEGAVSHNGIYYQQLSNTSYQVSFYDNICFE